MIRWYTKGRIRHAIENAKDETCGKFRGSSLCSFPRRITDGWMSSESGGPACYKCQKILERIENEVE